MATLAHGILDPSSVFTRAQALAAGLTDNDLRAKRFRALLRGVYVDASVPDSPLLRAQAVLACHEGRASASHATAARLAGLPLPPLHDEHVTALTPGERRRRAGVVYHVNPDAQVRRERGLLVSAYPQLFVELASLLTLVDLVVVGDQLVADKRVTTAALLDCSATNRLPGAARARQAAALVRERVDSPMETRLRLLIVLAGLPEPEVNLTLAGVNGERTRRFDQSYRHARLIIEYDGRPHIEREEQWLSDLDRREQLDAGGWRIIVVTADGIYRSPGRTLDRIVAAMRARRVAGVPRQLNPVWAAHFPGRN